jgi:hypothetical protein
MCHRFARSAVVAWTSDCPLLRVDGERIAAQADIHTCGQAFEYLPSPERKGMRFE